MDNPEKYQIKYWAGGNDFTYQDPKRSRSVKYKLFIVFSFLAVLAVIPILVFGVSSTQLNNSKKVSIITSPLPQNQESPKTIQVTITEPNSAEANKVEVLTNDNYWKISKRICGSGKYYLSVKDQNDSKPLYKGDSVTVTCIL